VANRLAGAYKQMADMGQCLADSPGHVSGYLSPPHRYKLLQLDTPCHHSARREP
jgi:hypothetical protein